MEVCVFFFQFEIRTVLEFQSGDGQARGTLQTTLGHPTVAPTNLIWLDLTHCSNMFSSEEERHQQDLATYLSGFRTSLLRHLLIKKHVKSDQSFFRAVNVPLRLLTNGKQLWCTSDSTRPVSGTRISTLCWWSPATRSYEGNESNGYFPKLRTPESRLFLASHANGVPILWGQHNFGTIPKESVENISL